MSRLFTPFFNQGDDIGKLELMEVTTGYWGDSSILWSKNSSDVRYITKHLAVNNY